MAAVEHIVAWCRAERWRLAHQCEELQSGRLRTYEKQAQSHSWLEIDATTQSRAYETRAEAEDAAAKAGKGYYARWGSYNELTKGFTSGPSFSPV